MQLTRDASVAFDNVGVSLGLHPKVALMYREKFGVPVPQDRFDEAAEWLRSHVLHHRQHEDQLRARAEASAAAGGAPDYCFE